MSSPTCPPEPPKRSKRGGNPYYLVAVALAALFSYYFNSHQQIGVYEDFNLSTRPHSKQIVRTSQEVNLSSRTIERVSAAHIRHITKPRLAIVVDDMCTLAQIKELKQLGLVLNYSFFPQKPGFPTEKLSLHVSAPLIHLPLEALNYHDDNPTLMVKSSIGEMNETIQRLRRQYPNVHIINNHTGSKFTENCEAMQRLLPLLAGADFNFLDSLTTSSSCARNVANMIAFPIWERDVFLDHDPQKEVIKNQILHAIECAKTKGSCIAICHPRPTTIEALKESKKLLREVELVPLDTIPRN